MTAEEFVTGMHNLIDNGMEVEARKIANTFEHPLADGQRARAQRAPTTILLQWYLEPDCIRIPGLDANSIEHDALVFVVFVAAGEELDRRIPVQQ